MAQSEAVFEKLLEEMRSETIQAVIDKPVIDKQSTKRIEKTRRPVVTILKTEGCRRKQSESNAHYCGTQKWILSPGF